MKACFNIPRHSNFNLADNYMQKHLPRTDVVADLASKLISCIRLLGHVTVLLAGALNMVALFVHSMKEVPLPRVKTPDA